MGQWQTLWRLGRAIRWAVGCGLISGWLGPGGWAAPLREARGLWMPVYVEGKPDPVASIRIDRVYRDHRRMGFFRVRALPVMVAEGVRLEVREPAGATNLLEELSRALQALAGNRGVEAREVSIRTGTNQTPALQAHRLSPPTQQKNPSFALERVRLQTADQQVAWPHAQAQAVRPGVLRLIGPEAQVLDYDLSCGQVTFNPSTLSGESP